MLKQQLLFVCGRSEIFNVSTKILFPETYRFFYLVGVKTKFFFHNFKSKDSRFGGHGKTIKKFLLGTEYLPFTSQIEDLCIKNLL